MSLLNNSSYIALNRTMQATERINKLKSKIDNLQASLEIEKSSQIDNVAQHIENLENQANNIFSMRTASINDIEINVYFCASYGF